MEVEEKDDEIDEKASTTNETKVKGWQGVKDIKRVSADLQQGKNAAVYFDQIVSDSVNVD